MAAAPKAVPIAPIRFTPLGRWPAAVVVGVVVGVVLKPVVTFVSVTTVVVVVAAMDEVEALPSELVVVTLTAVVAVGGTDVVDDVTVVVGERVVEVAGNSTSKPE